MNTATLRLLPAAAWLLTMLSGAAVAQTIFVDTSSDVVDFGGAQTVADLPGPDGRVSLPEAGLASDNTPGVQTIGFQIPQNEWLYQQFFPGRAVLKPFLGFRVFDTVILDGTTQTAFTGDTNPDGGEVMIWAESYLIDNVGGRMTGFDGSSIHLSGGSGNVIQANTNCNIELYDSHANLIGGSGPGEGNTGGFVIQVDRSNGNVVIGNTVSRVRVLGWVGGGQVATDNRIGGPAPGERNFIEGFGTWNSEGAPGGFAVQIFDATGTVVENNWIGTTPDGLAPGHLATTTGISFEGENHDTTIRGNRIAGIVGEGIGPHFAGYHFGSAIQVYGAGSGVTIVGNSVGLNASDEPVLGSVTGILMANYYLGPAQDVTIGGTAPGEGNEIAGHLTSGISVGNTFSGVRITGNSIHDNAGLGIDLITSGFLTGVTPNDALDVDTGGNGLQNFPVLQSADAAGGSLHVVGSLDSSASSTFEVEFFASPACDPSGFGEGQQFLGATTVATNASGHASLEANLAASVPPGWSVSATATATASGSTSEFAACVTVTGSAPVWTDLGSGLAGVAGIPSLAGTGTLQPGSPGSLALTGAKASASALLFASFASTPVPFKGGLLVPVPIALALGLTTDSAGSILLPFAWPAGVPAGTSLYFQCALQDAAGTQGVALSNALEALVP